MVNKWPAIANRYFPNVGLYRHQWETAGGCELLMTITPLSVREVHRVSSLINAKPRTLVSLCISNKNRWNPNNTEAKLSFPALHAGFSCILMVWHFSRDHRSISFFLQGVDT